MNGLEARIEQITSMAMQYMPKLLLACLVLIIGMWIANRIIARLGYLLDRSGISKEVQPFLISFFSVLIKMLVIFSVAGIVGIETTSFVAAIAAVGFAVGMALQGSLSNLASGVLILLLKPYKIGDFIEVGDEKGYVTEIQIMNTCLKTLDSKKVIIPNGLAINDMLKNSEQESTVRLEIFTFLPYNESFPAVKELLVDALLEIPKVLSDPLPFIGIEEYESHSIKLAIKPYCKVEDYEEVYYAVTEKIKSTLSHNNIKVAYSEGVELGPIGE